MGLGVILISSYSCINRPSTELYGIRCIKTDHISTIQLWLILPLNRKCRAQRRLVSYLVLWAQSTAKDYIRAEHKLHSISKSFISLVIIPQVMFLAYLYSAGTQCGNLHPTGWPILFSGPTQDPVLAKANTGKNWERFWKKCRWMDRKGKK